MRFILSKSESFFIIIKCFVSKFVLYLNCNRVQLLKHSPALSNIYSGTINLLIANMNCY